MGCVLYTSAYYSRIITVLLYIFICLVSNKIFIYLGIVVFLERNQQIKMNFIIAAWFNDTEKKKRFWWILEM